MKLLVTGGAGFIGSNFVRYWLAHHPGDSIVNIDKLTYAGSRQNVADLPAAHELVCQDICDASMEDWMQGADAVVHFAAESHVDRSIHSADVFVRTNVLGTQNLLEAARRLRVSKFVHVSTDEVYGALGASGEFVEDTPLAPNSPYAASKAGADLLARAYFKTHSLPVVVTRACNNYGPYQYPEKLIPLMTTNALDGIPLPVYGRGDQVREWLHVEDHCRGIEAALLRGRPGEAYNIGSAHQVTNLQMVKDILRLLNKSEDLIQFVQDRPAHDFRYALNCSKAQKELSWEPLKDFESGLKETLHWYRENLPWVQSVKDAAYQNYYAEMYQNRGHHLDKP